jgi:transglutaminase-like putative cysteine protease
MTDAFHNFEVEVPARTEFHGYMATTNVDIGVRQAVKLAVDRAREAGNNPRHGTVEIYFDDRGVGAKWIALDA